MVPAMVASFSEEKLPFMVTELLRKLEAGPEPDEIVGTDFLLIIDTQSAGSGLLAWIPY